MNYGKEAHNPSEIAVEEKRSAARGVWGGLRYSSPLRRVWGGLEGVEL
ncbi:MAG: hypothetical protein NWF13_09810 [Candidatus Bathyarchaeota archaeon]|nr:hypothetical protein [Candidatus Bathyarchaeota archaeon]